MTEAGDKPRRRRIWKYLLVVVCAGVVLLGALAWYATTDSFQAMVRRRLVEEVEKVTGGRAELGSFHVVPFRFRVEVRDLTIHGLEKPGEIPYAHIDRLTATVKVISVLGTEFGFHSVELDRPVIHFIMYPDGTSNQPRPKIARTSESAAAEELFSLSISHLIVQRGEILWNEQRIPLDLDANDVSADMRYSLLHRRYESTLRIGKAATTVQDFRPVAWAAEAAFTLSSNSVEIKSLNMTAGRSRLSANGRVDDLRYPRFVGTYNAVIDVGEAAAIARRPEIGRGTLELAGQGNWSAQDFALTGKLSARNLDWRNEFVKLSNAAGTAQFRVDRRRFAVSQIQARALGGAVSGDAEIANWLASSTASKGMKGGAGEATGKVTLRIKDVSVRELKQALVKVSRPVNRLNVAGALNGTAEVRWKGSLKRGQTAVALEVVPPSRPAAGELALSAHLKANYDAQAEQVDVAEFEAVMRGTQMRASGTLSSHAAMKLSVVSSDLEDWTPILSAWGTTQPLPFTLHGHAAFNGTATGKFSDVTLAGNLQTGDFDTVIAPSERFAGRTIHWDSLITDLQLSQHGFAARNSTLRHGATTIVADITANLQKGVFTDQSSFASRIVMRNADAAEILALAGYDYPLRGTMNLTLHAGGTRAAPAGEGHVQITNGAVYGEPIQQFTSDLRFANGDFGLNNIHLAHYEARVSGGATYNPSTHAFHFNLAGNDFDLARISRLQISRVKVDGRLDFQAQGSGTLEEPVINANVHMRDLAFDHERAGDFNVDAETSGAQLRLRGRSQFQNAELSIDGTIRMRDEWPSQINLHFNHLDVDSLLRMYAKGTVTGHSAVAGDLDLQGPLRKPRELNVTGNLSDFYADIENIKLRNNGPIRFTLNEQVLKVEQLRLIGEGTDLAANGSVEMGGGRHLNLKAQGHVNLQLVQSFNPDFTSSGVVTVDMAVGGTIDHPQTQGRLQISGASIAHIDLPSALSDMNGSLVFNENRLEIENLSGRTGGGLLTAQGYVSAYNRQLNFDFTLHGQDVRLRYPPGVSSTATADVRWVGTSAISTLSGDVTVTKLAITPGFDFGAYLAKASQATALPQTNPLLNRIKLDVHIATVPELQMQTAVVRLSGDADLRLRGTAAKPVLLGRADVLEGEIYFNGTKYRMERGDVTFSNPVTTTPVLDLQAATRVRDYDIIVGLNGPPDHMHINYRSEPPLPEADIIALLALGQTQEESAQLQQSGQGAFSQAASNAILAEALNATVSNRVQRLFGGSRIKIDPQGLSTETSPVRGPQVTIEQQVANNLTLTYSTNVSQASQQIIQVEYNVSRNVSVVAVRDQNGVVSFDVRIRRRKK